MKRCNTIEGIALMMIDDLLDTYLERKDYLKIDDTLTLIEITSIASKVDDYCAELKENLQSNMKIPAEYQLCGICEYWQKSTIDGRMICKFSGKGKKNTDTCMKWDVLQIPTFKAIK